MNVYLDDNLADKSLEAMLIKGGHTVVRSSAAGLKALGKLERSGAALGNDLIVLNHWR